MTSLNSLELIMLLTKHSNDKTILLARDNNQVQELAKLILNNNIPCTVVTKVTPDGQPLEETINSVFSQGKGLVITITELIIDNNLHEKIYANTVILAYNPFSFGKSRKSGMATYMNACSIAFNQGNDKAIPHIYIYREEKKPGTFEKVIIEGLPFKS